MVLDWAERAGFAYCHSGRLRRCSRKILFQDFPILYRIRPILGGMRKLDVIAFAAELLELGYSLRQVERAAGCSVNTIRKLRDRMKLLGMIPEHCGCGMELGHKGWCKWRLERRRQKETNEAHKLASIPSSPQIPARAIDRTRRNY